MYAPTVNIPSVMRDSTAGRSCVEVLAVTVGEAIDAVDALYPGFKARVVDGDKLRRGVNIYVGEEDVRFLEGLKTKLWRSDFPIEIVPAIAGGAA